MTDINHRVRRSAGHLPASLSRRGFILNAAGGASFLGVMHLLGEAGLLAQGGGGAGADPQQIFQTAVDEAIQAGEVGIQFAVYKDEELVVDVWGGVADKATGRQVDRQTLFNVFSVTKAITATALHIQAERGLVDYDAPIARYWPEFAAHGKDRATVRDGLSHRTGIPAMPAGVTPEQMADYDWMVNALANLEPVFEPGTTNAYHSYTWGWINSVIVERTDPGQRPFRQFVHEEIAQPLGIEDLWMGLPPEDEPRVAHMYNSEISIADQSTARGRSMPVQVAGTQDVFGRSIVRQAVIPGAGGIYNAISSARFFALLANEGQLDGVRLLSPERVRGLPGAAAGHRQARRGPRHDHARVERRVLARGARRGRQRAHPEPSGARRLHRLGPISTTAWAVAMCPQPPRAGVRRPPRRGRWARPSA